MAIGAAGGCGDAAVGTARGDGEAAVEVLLIEQLVLRHRREAVVRYPVYTLHSRLCPLSSQVG